MSKRTAVLVVHGMGSQRPLETVRGIVNAVWFEKDGAPDDPRKAWVHPEPSGVDIDLSVLTTNELRGVKPKRLVDFHELYWAHLMSETRSVAVLLWLFELARRGPKFQRGMKTLWWVGTIFLALLLLSVTLIFVQAIIQFPRFIHDMSSFVFVPLVSVLVILALSLLAASFTGSQRMMGFLFKPFFGFAVAVAIFTWADAVYPQALSHWSLRFLPAGFTLIAVWVLMGKRGLVVLACALAISVVVFFLSLIPAADPFTGWVIFSQRYSVELVKAWNEHRVPWGVGSEWSTVAAWSIIVTYLAVNVAFLQPYLGDAARYFRNSPGNVAGRREIRRQAVDMLAALHVSGKYDRIVVVAHSLGTVVAYDMLRAYFARVCRGLPTKGLGPEFEAVDQADVESKKFDRNLFRRNARGIMRRMAPVAAEVLVAHAKAVAEGKGPKHPQVWLVTDFVTLGSPLTHAKYLMCNKDYAKGLEEDFERRTREREFPTCPPRKIDADGLLVFNHVEWKKRFFHHGAQFGLARWTNLYFKRTELLWGDAVGGPLADVFGKAVLDVEVFTNKTKTPEFFTHTAYWDTKRGGRTSQHIVELRKAIDLEDAGTA